ncbi:hypothetical protein IGI37_001368 [Enterococcus sp. AZ194]|uniref:helix-turn-helix domain-containing protein n=1 Tax=Enterococcus sp. AZ194 TaxID=2774629 RepID=UPI003F24B581
MNLDAFLDQNQYPVLLLQWLELKKSTFCSIELLCEFAGISKFKALQYIDELNEKLSMISDKSKIVIEPSGEIHIYGISNLIVKQVRSNYLMNSEVFQLLNLSLELEPSLSQFAESRFLGRGQSYEIRKKLNAILSEYGVKYKKGKILGDELLIRNLIFALYINYFYGLYNPFSKAITKEAGEIESQLMSHLNLELTLTQKNKLLTLISIILIRSKHSHFCRLTDNSFTYFKYESEVYKVYQRHFSGAEEEKQSEWQYIFMFLVAEGMVKIDTTYENSAIKETASRFLNELPFVLEQRETYLVKIIHKINQLELKQKMFPFSTDFFSIEGYQFYLEENYPSLIQPIQNLVCSILVDEPIERNRLFVDIFFAVLEVIPGEMIENKVYVCVDFARGIAYTKFIIKQIEGFRNQNIVVQKKINSYTDIFISDYAVRNLRIEQIIWKEPPNADDWECFGNQVIAVKRKKSEVKNE